MAKTIVKEIIIMLLLCLAIILSLGILLYEYVPMTKTIPNPVSYSTPDDVKKELVNSSSIDESQIIMTYEVDATDLNNYTSIQDYKPGKANPFSSYETTATDTATTNGTGTTTANSSVSNNVTQTEDNQVQGNTATTNNMDNSSGTSSIPTTPTTPATPTTTSTPSSSSQPSATGSSQDTTTSGGHFFQDKGTK